MIDIDAFNTVGRNWEEIEGYHKRMQTVEPEYSPEDVAFSKPGADDPVNSPRHYASGMIECIDAMQAQSTKDEFRGHLKLCAVKYMWRYRSKGGAEDLKKARWYLDRLIAEMEADDAACPTQQD